MGYERVLLHDLAITYPRDVIFNLRLMGPCDYDAEGFGTGLKRPLEIVL